MSDPLTVILVVLGVAALLGVAAVFVYKRVTIKKRLEEAGIKGRRKPDRLE